MGITIDNGAANGQLYAMVRNVLPKSPDAPDFEALTKNLGKIQVEGLRSMFDAAKRISDDQYGNYVAILNKIVNDMVDLMQRGQAIDISSLIENLRESEIENQERLKTIDRSAGTVIRMAAKERPDLLALLNAAHSQSKADINRFAIANRDARWKLMSERALHQPSKPHGKIRGAPTDVDDYLKSID